jgi:hypothetical protein
MTAPSPTEPTQRKRNDAELLAISFHAYCIAKTDFEEHPSHPTAISLRVWARALQIDQIVCGAELVPDADLRSIVYPFGFPDPLEHIEGRP